MTQMPQDLMRGSQLMGIDVYGADNQKIGDIDEVLVDRQGKIHGLVVGVGDFLGIGQKDLGIGQKDVAIPFDQVQWMSNQEVQASANTGQRSTNTADTTVPSTATGGAGQPATTGSTAAGTTGSPGASGTMGGTATGGTTAGAGTTASGGDANTPARAMVKMTKADLQNAPEFRYSADANRAGAAGNTNPPPQSVNTPGNTAPNAPRQ